MSLWLTETADCIQFGHFISYATVAFLLSSMRIARSQNQARLYLHVRDTRQKAVQRTPPLPYLDYSNPAVDLCSRHNTPSSDLVVSVTREKSLTISRPGERYTHRLLSFLRLVEIWVEGVDLGLLLEIEDGNLSRGSCAQPVSVWREDKGVDLVTSLEGV